jgi:hypothetical protein
MEQIMGMLLLPKYTQAPIPACAMSYSCIKKATRSFNFNFAGGVQLTTSAKKKT